MGLNTEFYRRMIIKNGIDIFETYSGSYVKKLVDKKTTLENAEKERADCNYGCAEEHEQLAKWLEELKKIKEGGQI